MKNFFAKICRKSRFIFLFKTTENILRFTLNKYPKNLYLSLLVPPHYCYKEDQIRDFNRDGIKMKLNLKHYNDHLTYWFSKKDKLLNNIVKLIKVNDVVFDVGVNIGYYLFNFSQKATQGCVYGFEPNPKVFKYVKHNLELNSFKNIVLTNLGLGNEKGVYKMAQINSNLGMNKIVESNSALKTFDISVDTLDNFVFENNISKIDVIKIDVEGFEFNVLKGAIESLKKFKPILFIEIDNQNLIKNNSSYFKLKNWLNLHEYCIYDASDFKELEEGFFNEHFDILSIPKDKVESYSSFLN